MASRRKTFFGRLHNFKNLSATLRWEKQFVVFKRLIVLLSAALMKKRETVIQAVRSRNKNDATNGGGRISESKFSQRSSNFVKGHHTLTFGLKFSLTFGFQTQGYIFKLCWLLRLAVLGHFDGMIWILTSFHMEYVVNFNLRHVLLLHFRIIGDFGINYFTNFKTS